MSRKILVLGAIAVVAVAVFVGKVVIFADEFTDADAERWQQVCVVIAVWGVQLTVSPLWLRYYRFGPLEWLWRSLSYWRLQPFLRGR